MQEERSKEAKPWVDLCPAVSLKACRLLAESEDEKTRKEKVGEGRPRVSRTNRTAPKVNRDGLYLALCTVMYVSSSPRSGYDTSTTKLGWRLDATCLTIAMMRSAK